MSTGNGSPTLDKVQFEFEQDGGKFIQFIRIEDIGKEDAEVRSSTFKTYCWPAKGGRVVFRAAEIDGKIFIKGVRFEKEGPVL